ncbi:hypothetical protein FISHEDRAFT_55769 [Fistulina hepatica ATCC 64428]|uniref:Xylanolytic transcriptional activator regulatory domain-containing protein n=1 Tax=Fistulina hepatica ATCC 64428 TaxID=1128425 RepID=A0A0D7APU1_9AGAR|nr:hypothetical protein FISHEDRAFT_55769 [Fistulina hepatica ATCC 64428]
MATPLSTSAPSMNFHASQSSSYPVWPQSHELVTDVPAPIGKVLKRKRLAKYHAATDDDIAFVTSLIISYYASKACTYTDASGRPVPAPHASEPARPAPPTLLNTSQTASAPVFHPSGHPDPYPSHRPANSGSQMYAHVDNQLSVQSAMGDEASYLQRFRSNTPPYSGDGPTFTSALAQNRVPPYLLYAICACAAPQSKQPQLHGQPARFAGRRFARQAVALMFDQMGRLACEPTLETAQALCLLQLYDCIGREIDTVWNTQFRDLALQTLEKLGVHQSNFCRITPVPREEHVHVAMEREFARRVFWILYIIDSLMHVFLPQAQMLDMSWTGLRLPIDETSFELFCHQTLAEYLSIPAPREIYASELGHVVRITTVYCRIERALVDLEEGSCNDLDCSRTLTETSRALDSWASSLGSRLVFSEENTNIQTSMFNTGTGIGAWCFMIMHCLHAASVLTLQRVQEFLRINVPPAPAWAVNRISYILRMAGERANSSVLLSVGLYALQKYSQREDAEMQAWLRTYNNFWGTSMIDIIRHQATATTTGLLAPHTVYQGNYPSAVRYTNPGSLSRSSSDSSVSHGLGMSFGDMRVHASATKEQQQQQQQQQHGCESAMDPSVFRGGGRNESGGSDGIPQTTSLPSLKSSGLLDSWIVSHPNSAEMQQHIADLRPLASNPSDMFSLQDQDVRAPPVGLPWLANELR